MRKADYVLKSNAIFTGLSDHLIKGGVAITGNRITAVDEEDFITGWIGPETTVYDFGNEMVMPGLIDSHMHLFHGAFSNSEYTLQLFKTRSEEECAKLVKEFDQRHPDYQRITGIGWFPAHWYNSEVLPSCSSLDAVVPDKPVYLLAADGHTFWLNSKALSECGITKETKVSFGEIGKDTNEELNGLLFEIEAEAPAFEKAFSLPYAELKRIHKEFYKKLAKYGITSTTDMSASAVMAGSFPEYEAVSDLEKEGQLIVRLHLYPSLGYDANYDTAKKLRENYHSDMLKIAGLKQFVDGVSSTYTAFMLEPYSDRPETMGYSNYPAKVYRKCVVAANQEGFSVRLHALGDAAVRLALDTFEESNKINDNSNVVNCIEHVETIHPVDIERFVKLGVIASMQPLHLIIDFNEKIRRLGRERCQFEWPHSTLLNNGATLAFGTDFPVVDINPFPNIYSAITRCDENGEPSGVNPQEKITLAESLRAYTYGSACSIGRKNDLGTLETGKLADIVVLDKNLFSVPVEEIPLTKVKLTMMDGKIVYQV